MTTIFSLAALAIAICAAVLTWRASKRIDIAEAANANAMRRIDSQSADIIRARQAIDQLSRCKTGMTNRISNHEKRLTAIDHNPFNKQR